MNVRAWALLWPALCLLVACGSPIVGAECRHGFVRCDGRCVDPQTDPDNCGACGHSCGALACGASECGPGLRDAGLDGGDSTDGDGAGMDASVADGGRSGPGLTRGSAGSPFSPDAGASFPGCGLGERECAGQCVNTQIDTNHCGACGIQCGPDQFCVAGMCKDACDAPLRFCQRQCVDYQTDENNCGSCGNVCLSGICTDGECADVLPGTLIVIGHDYGAGSASISPAMKQIASNAVFQAPGFVHALVYRGKSRRGSCDSVLNAVEARKSVAGRDWDTSDVDADEVTQKLHDAGALLICAQVGASDAELQMLGQSWSLALAQFLYRGGVIVLFETQSGNNTGTYRLLEAADLFSATSREPVTPAKQTLIVQPPPVGVAWRAGMGYRSSASTVHFLGVADGLAVVKDNMGEAVVIQRVISP